MRKDDAFMVGKERSHSGSSAEFRPAISTKDWRATASHAQAHLSRSGLAKREEIAALRQSLGEIIKLEINY